MRRKQSVLIVTLLILGSLAFVSMTRPASQVDSVHPDDTTGEGPPITDTDKDKIPDLHEQMYSQSINITLDDVIYEILGLDYENASDNESDFDNDGLNSLEEYCWPYDMAHCFVDRKSLTGIPPEATESGLREYLDPRVADTDGDGLPDGYEIWMCMRETGELNESNAWTCQDFDPLNRYDGFNDSDRCISGDLGCGDGFDVDRDGIIEVHEWYTNAEEYSYGAPDNWTTEIHGLRCLDLLDACSDNVTRPTDSPGWLGTDPLRNDSDFYYWSGSRELPKSSRGDSILDGWEVFFGLDPLNETDSLLDSDMDGWDLDRDGMVMPDGSRATIYLGEAYSNLEEYFTYMDNGTWVRAGLKSTLLESADGPVEMYDQGTTPQILHHDVRALQADHELGLLYVGTKRGITIFEPATGGNWNLALPPGGELNDLMHWTDQGGESRLILATDDGIEVWSLDVEGHYDQSSTITGANIGVVSGIHQLSTGSGNLDLLLAGEDGNAWTATIDGAGQVLNLRIAETLVSALLMENATIQDVVHTSMDGSQEKLYVGTDSGFFVANTADAIGDYPVMWIFNETDAEQYVRQANPSNISHSANVRTLVLDGPRQPDGSISSVQTIWVGTGGGVHQFSLLDESDPSIAFSRDRMQNDDGDDEGANDVHAILPLGNEVIIGSRMGTWVLDGDYARGLGIDDQHTRIPGFVTELVVMEVDGNDTIFAGLHPGRYSNRMLINPFSNDSDLDGMPDGWENAHGLDPTDPFDRDEDLDVDGINLNPYEDSLIDHNWTNLDEYRYIASTPEGWNGTDPRLTDTDGDGLVDGAEYWGWFFSQTNFTCHYEIGEYVCDDAQGEAARQVYALGWQGTQASGATDRATDPTNPDTDQDGMPDGWEIANRRWIGTTFHGGNEWSMDPMDPTDADEDADSDGLTNICEYQWELTLQAGLESGLPSYGESIEAIQNWTKIDPNNPDSDGDSLPDGWEARYSCDWLLTNVGINPLNGSDALTNPDGDGYDVDRDGVISPDEALNNWMEYHLKDAIILGNITVDGDSLPAGFENSLWDASWLSGASRPFGESISPNVAALTPGIILTDIGSSNPLSSDSDGDGMPDGWEVWFARWDAFDLAWTLNPVNESDPFEDPDGDGMTNWEEYNSIDANSSETDSNTTSPQYHPFKLGNMIILTPWNQAVGTASFGTYLSSDQYNMSGPTCDPNNPDSDGDGMLDGIELLFTQWNFSFMNWSLNPLVAGDGGADGDQDALTDMQELNLTYENPLNGGPAPPDAPKMWEEAYQLEPANFTQRISDILSSKQGRAYLALVQHAEWEVTGIAPPLLSTLIGITDPTNNDTDDDGMIDGYEYWFTEWDLDANRWSMNPLTSSDVNFDTDDDSYDCNENGILEAEERYTNLREYEARIYGKESMRYTFPPGSGLIDYGDDAIAAKMDEESVSAGEARSQLVALFASKDVKSADRLGRINTAYADNFNLSLFGITDPSHSDSDLDGMPDGWEFCYGSYAVVQPVDAYRWTLNPVSPLDVDYDPDEDGWFGRTSADTPAFQGSWTSHIFTQAGPLIPPGNSPLWFTNWMEFDNGTRPDLNDTDADSVNWVRVADPNDNSITLDYYRDYALTDGREVFKFGTNPTDNDTDWDMLPDWYEYDKGWNESNDNWSSYVQVEVVWEQYSILGNLVMRPLHANGMLLERPILNYTWATFDPTDPSDSLQDPDKDGNWECSNAGCTYTPYNNFQEFFGLTNQSITSATLARSTPVQIAGTSPPITIVAMEWWELRAALLAIDRPNEMYWNYMRMYRANATDELYALVLDDHDFDYLTLNVSDDEVLVKGDWTDPWDCVFCQDRYHFPNTGLGERVWGWWILDIDGDHIADGTDPLNWDTDGDWLNDWFEIENDMLDSIRGNGPSPIRYDDRTTNSP